MPDACAVTRQLSGEIVDVNEAFERIFGYRREEIVGRTTTEFGLWVTTADRERALEALLAEQGRIRGYEATLRTREGVLRTCLLSAEQLQVGGDRLLVVAARDVTEMKQAAESLRLTQFAMDHASEGVYWIGANAEFIYVNDEACRSLGYSREELLGMTVHDIAPRRPPASWGELWNTLRERGTLTYETVHRARDGRVFPVELALNYQLFEGRELVCGLARDISERKLAERAAHESAERLRALIEVVSDVVIVIDALGVIQYSSPSVRQVLGYAVEEVVGRSALEFLHPDDRGPAERALVALTAEGPDPGVQQFRARHKDGSWRHVEAVGAVPPPGSPLEGVVVAYRDMTARRELEEHLRETSKLESLGTLAGGVAHDFNNLLTGIIGYVDFVATESTLSPEGQHDVAVVRELAVRAGGLTRQLLAFSRRQTLELTNVQLNSTIVELTKMLGRIIGEDIALRLDLDQDLATVRGDVGQIEQIIMNLAVNARDAMPGGGTLAIETRNVVLDREYSRLHPDTEPGPYVMLAVTDTGCGMDAETQARVFEPFFTTKEVGKGTGLGLSVVYGIVKQHSGGIAVDSTKGHGTRFTVYLPAVTAQVEPTISSPTETGSGRGTETVLVVEDEEVLRQLVVKALENGGYTVLSARHAAEAEELFDTHGGPIDLLLTDVVMPGPSGPELAARLQGKRPGLKVLFTSGFTEHPAVAQGALTSGLPFIQKPFAPVDLLQKVREALGT
jgi:PAS domain S-box-containing protein